MKSASQIPPTDTPTRAPWRAKRHTTSLPEYVSAPLARGATGLLPSKCTNMGQKRIKWVKNNSESFWAILAWTCPWNLSSEIQPLESNPWIQALESNPWNWNHLPHKLVSPE